MLPWRMPAADRLWETIHELQGCLTMDHLVHSWQTLLKPPAVENVPPPLENCNVWLEDAALRDAVRVVGSRQRKARLPGAGGY